MSRSTVALVLGISATAALAAATGRVVDPDGKPLAGIEVCNVLHDVVMNCVTTDAQGYYRIGRTTGPTLFVRGSGFVPVRIEAVERTEPVALTRAASLLVHVVDATTHEPVARGKVILNYTSGLQIGDEARFGPGGVQITSLRPGTVLARCEADGYAPGGPVAVELGEGERKEIRLEVKRLAAAAR